MKKQILVLVIPFIFANSCNTAKKASLGASSGNTELITDNSYRKPVVDKDLFKATIGDIPLDTVYIAKDTLNIFTKRITGCNADNFKLIWNGDLGKAIPPKTSVKLLQFGEGTCRERHKFHLFYNISSLKLKTDTSSNKMTIIQIGGWGKTASYSHN